MLAIARCAVSEDKYESWCELRGVLVHGSAPEWSGAPKNVVVPWTQTSPPQAGLAIITDSFVWQQATPHVRFGQVPPTPPSSSAGHTAASGDARPVLQIPVADMQFLRARIAWLGNALVPLLKQVDSVLMGRARPPMRGAAFEMLHSGVLQIISDPARPEDNAGLLSMGGPRPASTAAAAAAAVSAGPRVLAKLTVDMDRFTVRVGLASELLVARAARPPATPPAASAKAPWWARFACCGASAVAVGAAPYHVSDDAAAFTKPNSAGQGGVVAAVVESAAISQPATIPLTLSHVLHWLSAQLQALGPPLEDILQPSSQQQQQQQHESGASRCSEPSLALATSGMDDYRPPLGSPEAPGEAGVPLGAESPNDSALAAAEQEQDPSTARRDASSPLRASAFSGSGRVLASAMDQRDSSAVLGSRGVVDMPLSVRGEGSQHDTARDNPDSVAPARGKPPKQASASVDAPGWVRVDQLPAGLQQHMRAWGVAPAFFDSAELFNAAAAAQWWRRVHDAAAAEAERAGSPHSLPVSERSARMAAAASQAAAYVVATAAEAAVPAQLAQCVADAAMLRLAMLLSRRQAAASRWLADMLTLRQRSNARTVRMLSLTCPSVDGIAQLLAHCSHDARMGSYASLLSPGQLWLALRACFVTMGDLQTLAGPGGASTHGKSAIPPLPLANLATHGMGDAPVSSLRSTRTLRNVWDARRGTGDTWDFQDAPPVQLLQAPPYGSAALASGAELAAAARASPLPSRASSHTLSAIASPTGSPTGTCRQLDPCASDLGSGSATAPATFGSGLAQPDSLEDALVACIRSGTRSVSPRAARALTTSWTFAFPWARGSAEAPSVSASAAAQHSQPASIQWTSLPCGSESAPRTFDVVLPHTPLLHSMAPLLAQLSDAAAPRTPEHVAVVLATLLHSASCNSHERVQGDQAWGATVVRMGHAAACTALRGQAHHGALDLALSALDDAVLRCAQIAAGVLLDVARGQSAQLEDARGLAQVVSQVLALAGACMGLLRQHTCPAIALVCELLRRVLESAQPRARAAWAQLPAAQCLASGVHALTRMSQACACRHTGALAACSSALQCDSRPCLVELGSQWHAAQRAWAPCSHVEHAIRCALAAGLSLEPSQAAQLSCQDWAPGVLALLQPVQPGEAQPSAVPAQWMRAMTCMPWPAPDKHTAFHSLCAVEAALHDWLQSSGIVQQLLCAASIPCPAMCESPRERGPGSPAQASPAQQEPGSPQSPADAAKPRRRSQPSAAAAGVGRSSALAPVPEVHVINMAESVSDWSDWGSSDLDSGGSLCDFAATPQNFTLPGAGAAELPTADRSQAPAALLARGLAPPPASAGAVEYQPPPGDPAAIAGLIAACISFTGTACRPAWARRFPLQPASSWTCIGGHELHAAPAGEAPARPVSTLQYDSDSSDGSAASFLSPGELERPSRAARRASSDPPEKLTPDMQHAPGDLLQLAQDWLDASLLTERGQVRAALATHPAWVDMVDLLTPAQAIDGRFVLFQLLGAGAYAEVYSAAPVDAPESMLNAQAAPHVAKLTAKQGSGSQCTLAGSVFPEARALALVQARAGCTPELAAVAGDMRKYWIVQRRAACNASAWRASVAPELVTGHALRIFALAAQAVAALHASGVLHFDIKGDNVLLSSTDASEASVMLGDFGEAMAVPHVHAAHEEAYTLMARGTDCIKSPEMLLVAGRAQTAREAVEGSRTHTGAAAASDVWSLGCLLVELLTGESPFAALCNDAWGEFMHRLQHCDGVQVLPDRSIEAIQATLAPPKAALIMRVLGLCLRREPAARVTAREVAEQAQAWLSGDSQ